MRIDNVERLAKLGLRREGPLALAGLGGSAAASGTESRLSLSREENLDRTYSVFEPLKLDGWTISICRRRGIVHVIAAGFESV